MDMKKAYDKTSWNFLDQVMDKFSFSDIWRRWIKKYISIIIFYVLMNGEASGFFNVTNGLC